LISKILPFLSLISSLIFIKSEKLIYARFSFCFATLFSSLTLYDFNKPLASILYLTILTIFSSALIGFIENKFKLTLGGKLSFAKFLSLTLASILIIFLLKNIEAIGLLASALIAFFGIINNFNLLKRFLSILLFEGLLFPLLEIYFQKPFFTLIFLLTIFFSSLILTLTANFIFKYKLGIERGVEK
jgi:hypothetical protein